MTDTLTTAIANHYHLNIHGPDPCPDCTIVIDVSAGGVLWVSPDVRVVDGNAQILNGLEDL